MPELLISKKKETEMTDKKLSEVVGRLRADMPAALTSHTEWPKDVVKRLEQMGRRRRFIEFLLESLPTLLDAIEAQGERIALKHKLRNVIAHASGGAMSDHADVNLDEICVGISQHHNRIWDDAQKQALSATQPDARPDRTDTDPVTAIFMEAINEAFTEFRTETHREIAERGARAIEAALSRTDTPASVEEARELLIHLDDACGLIQEAKGIAGAGSITDHLDFAEHWIRKVEAALYRTDTQPVERAT